MRWRGPTAIINDRPIISSGRIIEKKILAVSLKGLGAKTK
jgi:hypothetical protein